MSEKRKLDCRDLLVVLGAISLGYGVWLVHPPSVYIVGGISAMLISIRN